MEKSSFADKLLSLSASFWFLIAVAGQWLFAFYVAAFYGVTTFKGDFEAWNTVLANGYIPGDTPGNLLLGTHLLLAIVISLCGPLQLIPKIRELWPRFHHWNGRIYMATVIIVSLAGLFMVWTRGMVGGMTQNIGISIDAVLIILFALIALRYAVAREIAVHRRWALRLFMVVNAVWFFRIGLMFWIVLNKGPVGFDPESFTGPFLTFLAFAQMLIPLAFLELYLRAGSGKNAMFKYAVALIILLLSFATAFGIFAATMGLWLPRI